MPNYRVHLFGGLLIFLFSHYFIGSQYVFVNLACALFGSLFPDLDTKSKIQILIYRLIGVMLIILLFYKLWKIVLFLVPVLIFPLVIHHRGVTHQFWFITLLSFMMAYFLPLIGYLGAINFFLGALSHIILDRVVK